MAGRLREGEKEEVGRKRRDGRRRQISWCVVSLQKTCPALWAVLRVPTAGPVPAEQTEGYARCPPRLPVTAAASLGKSRHRRGEEEEAAEYLPLSPLTA